MKNVGYYNGEMCALEDLKIPALDRVVFFGDGVYDATTVNDGVILFEEDHLDRFFNSMAAIKLQPAFTREELRGILRQVIDAAEDRDLMLYWQATRGTAMRNHAFPVGVDPNLLVFVKPLKFVLDAAPVKGITCLDNRHTMLNVKTLNLQINCMAQTAARDAGAEEAIFVRDGIVTECAHCNLFILEGGKLVTHPLNNLILPGITRKRYLEAAAAIGLPVEERAFDVAEMMAADEVFAGSSTGFMKRMDTIDGQPVGMKDPDTLVDLMLAVGNICKDYIESHRA